MTDPAPCALVTGGGQRLGRALVEGLQQDGWRVAIHYHSSDAGARAVARDEDVVFQADLRDADAARALAGRATDALGRLDLLVNSAGVMRRQPFETVTPEDFDGVLGLNLRAYFFTAQGAAPHLRPTGGSIVNITDASGVDPWPSYLPHSLAKAGVQHLTRGLAQVLAPEIRVNAILPGAVLPPDDWSDRERERAAKRSLLRRTGEAADVVAALRFLLTTDFATGSTVVVDGGALVRPRGDG